MPIPIAATPWYTTVAAFAAVAFSLMALLATKWTESQRLSSQHRAEERRELKKLIGRYRGRLLEAAVDWDRRMHQLYESRGEREGRSGDRPYAEGADAREPCRLSSQEEFLADSLQDDRGPLVIRFGKYTSPREYLFRSYVYRFVALCRLARRFETEAYYIDSKVADPEDVDFLKYAKAFLWAMTSSDLHRDKFPGIDHFRNDEFRPMLDACSAELVRDVTTEADGAVQAFRERFDLARFDELVRMEHERLSALAQPAPARDRSATPATEKTVEENAEDDAEEDAGADTEEPVADEVLEEHPARDEAPDDGELARVLEYRAELGNLILFLAGLRKWRDHGGQVRVLDRHRWNRLVVLHLLVMAFINEFGYKWQRRSVSDFRLAVSHITDYNVARTFARSIPSLGLRSLGWPDYEDAHEAHPNWSTRHVDERWDRVLRRLQCLELPPVGSPDRLRIPLRRHPRRAAAAFRATHARQPGTTTIDVLLRERWREGALLRTIVQALGVEGGAAGRWPRPAGFGDRVVALWQQECLVIGLRGVASDEDVQELRALAHGAPVRFQPGGDRDRPNGALLVTDDRRLEPTDLFAPVGLAA